MTDNKMRIDSTIEALHEYGSEETASKRKTLVSKMNEGFEYVVFTADVFTPVDVFTTKVKRYE